MAFPTPSAPVPGAPTVAVLGPTLTSVAKKQERSSLSTSLLLTRLVHQVAGPAATGATLKLYACQPGFDQPVNTSSSNDPFSIRFSSDPDAVSSISSK